jgi:hypothetical protein
MHELLKYLISITMSQDYPKSIDFVDDQIDLKNIKLFQ